MSSARNLEHAQGALTWLFVPGDRPERFAKAASSGADAVILDLEDAVAPENKDAARSFVVEYLRDGNPAYVRMNGERTDYLSPDLEALDTVDGRLRGIILPKSERVAAFQMLDEILPADAVTIPLIETATGVANAYELAAAPRVARLVFGSADLMLDTGIEDEPRGLLLARSTLVLASRAAGLEGPVDGITTNLDDPAVAQRDAEDGRRLGFAGKLCLHPRQVAPVLGGFAPSADEAQWADRVLAAAGEANGKAVRFEGQMIDRPLLARAQRIAARYQGIESMLDEMKGTRP